MILINIVGTLPEWFAALVSLAGFSLIAATLRSQIEVQKQQQKITEIELRRHKIEVRPELKLSFPEDCFSHSKDKKYVFLKVFVENSSSNIALNFKINIKPIQGESHLSKRPTYSHMRGNQKSEISVYSIPRVSEIKLNILHYFSEFVLTITYTDIIGNPYKYEVWYYMGPDLKLGVYNEYDNLNVFS